MKTTILAILLLSSTVNAEVPHTFTSHTPAKADEVNANFTSLDNRLKSVESNAIAQPVIAHSISYVKNAKPVGYQFNEGGKTYRLILFPFIDFATGNRYTIKLPKEVNADNSIITPTITVVHQLNALSGSLLSIDGYSSSFSSLYETRIFGVYYTTPRNAVNRQTFIGIKIKINETEVSVNFIFNSLETEKIYDADLTGSDFTDIVWPTVSDPLNDIQSTDRLIDYIEVTKL